MTKKELFDKFYETYGKFCVNDFLIKSLTLALASREFLMDVIDGTININYEKQGDIY